MIQFLYMKKYKIYFYVIAIIFSVTILYISAKLYGSSEIKYNEVLVNPEK